MQKDNRLSWGVSLLVFGTLFLINQLHILPASVSEYVFDVKNYPIILGVIFLLFHKIFMPPVGLMVP